MLVPVAHLKLPSRFDGSTATAVAEDLKPFRGRDLDLCGMDVERIGGQGVQLLLSAFRTWSADGQKLRLVDPSLALCMGLETLGFPFSDAPTQEPSA